MRIIQKVASTQSKQGNNEWGVVEAMMLFCIVARHKLPV
jgi:hypothetical protein